MMWATTLEWGLAKPNSSQREHDRYEASYWKLGRFSFSWHKTLGEETQPTAGTSITALDRYPVFYEFRCGCPRITRGEPWSFVIRWMPYPVTRNVPNADRIDKEFPMLINV